MNYRTANSSDFSRLKKLGKTAYAEYSKILDGEHWQKMYIFLDDETVLASLIDKSTVFVCEEDNQIIGMVFFVPSGHFQEHYDKSWSQIRYLAVDPNHRGKGVGKKLTELCIQKATEMKEEFLSLHTSEFMGQAIQLYESLGFIKGKDFIHYGKNYWIYTLSVVH